MKSETAHGPSLGSGGGFRGEGIGVSFRGVTALDDVDIVIEENEILGLIGPNGAGKTTAINVLSGLFDHAVGRRRLDGADVTKWSLSRLASKGVVRSFQGTRLFANLTAKENLEVSALGVGIRRAEARSQATALLDEAGLGHRAEQQADSLPAGDQQVVAVLRALAAKPRFLLLDEPAAGLNEVEGERLVTLLRSVRDEYGCGILIVEHDMAVIMSLCDRIHVLNYGKSIALGTPEEIRRDRAVIDAYLGVVDA